jgi:TldD protein
MFSRPSRVAVVVVFGCASPAARVVSKPPPAPPDVPAKIDVDRPPAPAGTTPAPALDAMTAELKRSFEALSKHEAPPYFASYEVTDSRSIAIGASFGTLTSSVDDTSRVLDVDVRVGDYKRDNTHVMRSSHDRGQTFTQRLPIDDDGYALRTALWRATDDAYVKAAEQLAKVKTNEKVEAQIDDQSDDFSHEAPVTAVEAPATIELDVHAWEMRLRTLSAAFRAYTALETARVDLTATAETRYFASSDGTRLQLPERHLRVTVSASALTDDGMFVHRVESFDAAAPDGLPTDAQIAAKIELVARDVTALRAAPVADPYIGPTLLEGKAAGVFFHEVFGHRIEGHRQKSDAEGQTFTKKVGEPIMPAFIDVYDDPTIGKLDGTDLNGFYRYDDEGVAATKASLVERGVLKGFLMDRGPISGFPSSNGHGRRRSGHSVVARQGNLVVAPSRTVDRAVLRQMLLDQIKQQGKPYGLIVRELDGGFTLTQRFEPQSFKLLPVMLYRLYPDGHEELVRGADLEGTPLRALGDIIAAGNDVDTFNGYCGAESGFVPVSATSPSLLIAHLEIAKKASGSTKPPILPAPAWTEGAR